MQQLRVYSHQPVIEHDELGRITQQVAGPEAIRIPAPGSRLHRDKDYLAQLQRLADIDAKSV